MLSYLDLLRTLAAIRCQVLFETVLAVEFAFFFNKSNVGERALAVSVDANEVLRTPDATQCSDEWTSAKNIGSNVRIIAFL